MTITIEEDNINKGNKLLIDKRYSEALNYFKEIVKNNSNHFLTWNNIGWSLNGLKKYSEAIEALDKTLTIEPSFFPAIQGKSFALLAMKKYDDALVVLNQGLSIRPNDVNTLISKGLLLIIKKRYTEALTTFKKAIEIDSDNTKAWLGYGITLFVLKKTKEANNVFNKLMDKDPNNHLVLYYQALLLGELGRFSEAMTNYDRLLEHRPNFLPLLFNKANILLKTKKYEEAKELYEKVLSIDSQFIDAYNNLAITLVALNRPKQALELYDKLPRPVTDDIELLNNRAIILKILGKIPEAISIYDRLITLDNNYLLAWINKIITLSENNYQKEKKDTIERLLKQLPKMTIDWSDSGKELLTLLGFSSEYEWLECKKMSVEEMKKWFVENKGKKAGFKNYYDWLEAINKGFTTKKDFQEAKKLSLVDYDSLIRYRNYKKHKKKILNKLIVHQATTFKVDLLSFSNNENISLEELINDVDLLIVKKKIRATRQDNYLCFHDLGQIMNDLNRIKKSFNKLKDIPPEKRSENYLFTVKQMLNDLGTFVKIAEILDNQLVIDLCQELRLTIYNHLKKE